jgi:hypothetical protein
MNIAIMFFVCDEPKLTLKWPAVPRVGDTVDISTVNPQMQRLHCVERLVWRHVAGELKVDVHLGKEIGDD